MDGINHSQSWVVNMALLENHQKNHQAEKVPPSSSQWRPHCTGSIISGPLRKALWNIPISKFPSYLQIGGHAPSTEKYWEIEKWSNNSDEIHEKSTDASESGVVSGGPQIGKLLINYWILVVFHWETDPVERHPHRGKVMTPLPCHLVPVVG